MPRSAYCLGFKASPRLLDSAKLRIVITAERGTAEPKAGVRVFWARAIGALARANGIRRVDGGKPGEKSSTTTTWAARW